MQDLIQMLEEYEIKNVISIDDGWSIVAEIEKNIENAQLDLSITVEGLCEKYGIDVDEEGAVDYNECSHISLREANTIESIAPKTFAVICEALEVDIDASLKTLKSILSQLEEKFNIYTGVELESSYQTLNGNTLYILDKDMGANRENEFLDYIVNIIEERKAYSDLVIVYSNEVAGLLEHDKKVDYLKINNKGNDLEILYQFWPLSKITDETQLVMGIKEMVSKSMYGKALSKMIEMKRISVEKAFKDLLHINIDNLDDMIIDAYIEGGKITESYELLIDSLIKKNVLEQILSTNVLDYEKGLLQYSTKRSKVIMEEKGISSKNKYDNLRVESNKKKLLNSGTLLFNVADYSVNKEYNNPSMGDIYVFTEARSKQRYAGMLISHECSTMIRLDKYPDNIKRKADELLLLLFEIVEIKEESINDYTKKLDDCIWPIKIDEKICLLKNTKRSMYITPEILDLCGLNASGKAKVQFEEESLEYKSVYSREYYKDFKQTIEKKIEDTVSQVIQTRGIETSEDAVNNMIISLAYGIEFKEDFELQRICKIDEKQTLHIIHEYLNGIAKIGLHVYPNLQDA